MSSVSALRWPSVSWQRVRLTAKTIGFCALIMSVLAASTYNTFAKDLTEKLSPLSLLFVSECLTAFFILLSFGLLPTLRKVAALRRSEWLPILAVGVFTGILGPFSWFTGLQYTTALNASLFGNTDMLFVIVLATLLLREKMTRELAVSALCMTVGVLFVIFRGRFALVAFAPGDLILLLSSLSFSIGSIIYSRYLRNAEPQIVVLLRSCLAITFFFVLSAFLTKPLLTQAMRFPWRLLPLLLGFAFISRFVNAFAYYEAVERLPVTTVTLFSSFSIICGAIFASLFNGDALHWYHFAAGGCMLVGALLFGFLPHHKPGRRLHHHPHAVHPRPAPSKRKEC